MSDRLIHQNAYLYGVRFGAETNYCLLDIDINSTYHPKQDPLAISRIAAVLEPLGLVSYIACTSSYSGGLHLYFPFQQMQSSWQLAIVLACLLENAGFKLQPGQLEIFPNPKPYATDGTLSLFNAHRLPLQIGSYLLDQALQPIWSDSYTFVKQWRLVQQRNDIDGKALKQILKQAKRKHFGISGKAEKFINDLNAEIELGWTGYGQTNRLLGRITMRAYIFHHIFSGGEPLKGDALINEIVETARLLPGYEEWCRHQHEIEQRAEEWARCIENSHYFHFGDQSKKRQPESQDPELTAAIDQSPSWNQRQSAATRDRIRRAIADLLEGDTLPIRPTARFQALLKYGIGGASLYRHRDLWHPDYLNVGSVQDPTDLLEISVENPPDPPSIKMNCQLNSVEDAANWHSSPSLLPIGGGDNASSNGFIHQSASAHRATGSNSSSHSSLPDSISNSSQNAQHLQQVLFDIEAHQETYQKAARASYHQQQRINQEASEAQLIARMNYFLASGDPILVAESLAWAQTNSVLLEDNQLSLLPDYEAVAESMDLLTLWAAIVIEIQQLAWLPDQVSHYLYEQFGGRSRAGLTNLELKQWLQWLKSQ